MLPKRDDFRRVTRPGLTPVLLVGLVAGCTGSGSTSGGGSVEVRDFSGFTEFSFEREPGLGFCPPLDAVFDATLALDDEGLYAANISVLLPKSWWPKGRALAKSADSARIREVWGSGHPSTGPACPPPGRSLAITQGERRPTESRAAALEGACPLSRCTGFTYDAGVSDHLLEGDSP